MHDDIKAEMVELVPRLRRFAYALTSSRDDGDDLVQTACLKALQRLDQYQAGTRFDSWMFRIVQTAWIDQLRSRRRRGTPADLDTIDQLSDEGASSRQIENRLVLDRVRTVMSDLPESQRAVLALVAIEGFSYAEAAEILSVPVGTIMSRLSRGRGRLIAEMGDASQ